MQKTIRVIDRLQKEGIIKEYAIAGGVAAIFYVEPILTYDLDIFFIPTKEEKIITLSPIYKWLKQNGYEPHEEHVIIEGVPVQFIPVYNELVKAAVIDAAKISYKDAKTKVIKAEYLLAIMLQTFRPKDKERIVKLLDEAKLNMAYLLKILGKHNLDEKFKRFKDLYYGK